MGFLLYFKFLLSLSIHDDEVNNNKYRVISQMCVEADKQNMT